MEALLPRSQSGRRKSARGLAILVAILALAATVSPAGAQTRARGSPDLGDVTHLIVDRTNDFRRGEGREPVGLDPKLSAAARSFAAFMARSDRYGHEADGRTPAQRAQEQGYAYCIILENIASLYSSAGFGAQELANRAMHGWRQSEGHRRNLLDPEVTEIGVAIAQSGTSGTYYAVQLFGRPHSKRIEFRVANPSPVAVEYELNGKAISLPPRATRMHQECRAARLTVRPPGERHSTSVRPADGDRYEVERLGSGYHLKKTAS
jgi:uncharacterized protein YkwD